MALARYWRAVRLESYSGQALELTEFHLLDNVTRVGASVTPTASIAPTSGSVANLVDDDTATGALWPSSKGLVLHWDFGVAVDVNNIQLGSAIDKTRFPLIVVLEYSTDGLTWTSIDAFAGIAWPGARTNTDSPAVYPKWNPTDISQYMAVSEHGKLLTTRDGANQSGRGVVGVSTGKYQFEVAFSGSRYSMVAVATAAASLSQYPGQGSNSYAYWSFNGNKFQSDVAVVYGSPYVDGDVIGVVLDMAAGSLSFYKNGIDQGVAYTGLSGTFFPMFGTSSSMSSGPTSSAEMMPLQYPVDGAQLWGVPNSFRIRVNAIPGRVVVQDISLVLSAGADYPYSGVQTTPVYRARYDFTFKGDGRIAGTVKETGAPDMPVHRKVRLIREKDGLLMREQWTDRVTGEYDFKDIELGCVYTVISYDHTGNYRAVVSDRLVPEIAP